MTTICWEESNLSNLGLVFLRHVRENMRGREESIVRFGQTGTGVQPNYEVRYPNGVVRPIRGSTHDGFDGPENFDASNLSREFNLRQIDEAIRRAGGR
jgi:hypothetical protein